MSWLKIDDKLSFHPKIMAAGNAAVGAWVRMMAWSCLHLTDGHVPASTARTIASVSELKNLVESGLLHRVDGGFSVHDFSDWNPSSEEVKARREEIAAKRREAGKRGGIRSGEVRSAKQVESKHEANDEANCFDFASPGASILSQQKRTPVPVPVPVPDPEELTPHRSPLAEPATAQRPVAGATAKMDSVDADRGDDAERLAAGGPRALFAGLDGGSEGSAPKNATTGPKRRTASACPPSDASDADLTAWCDRWKLDPAHPEFAQWLDHHRAKRSLFADWTAAFRTWQRNAVKWQRGAPAATAFRPGIQPAAAPGDIRWTPGDGSDWLEDEQ